MSDDIGLIRYNTSPSFCGHALDHNAEYYRRAGVTRLHNHDRLDLDAVRAGDFVFVKTDALPVFSQVLPKLKVPITLVTGVSDISPIDHEFLIHDERIIAWCGQCLPLWSEKVLQLPMGFAEREREYGDQDTLLGAVGGLPWDERPIDILVTAMANTAPERGEIVIEGAHVSRDRLPYREYLALMARSKFVVCPRGNAPDSIRFWETLAVGAVPITRTGILDPLYRAYGAQIVEEWAQAAEVAKRCRAGHAPRDYALRCFAERTGLFFASYWRDKVLAHRDRLLAGRTPS